MQWLAQPFETDIDHTGRVSEAIVTLPGPVAPQQAVELTVSYAGTIQRDAARLTRIGMPEQLALSTDWDQVSSEFTAIRGFGFVAWYPVASESVSMSEGNTLFDAIARWQERSRGSALNVRFNRIANMTLVSNGVPQANASAESLAVSFGSLENAVPTFTLGAYEMLERPSLTIHYLPDHTNSARDWALAAEKTAPMISQWLGPPKQKVTIVDLADESANPFNAGPSLFAPLTSAPPDALAQRVAPVLTHAAITSKRPWIREGLAQFAQIFTLESSAGRNIALRQLERLSMALAEAEQPQPASQASDAPKPATPQSLVTTTDPAFYRTKGMFVWSMLRDMLGDETIQRALAGYRATDDKEPSYMQRLLEVQAKRSLETFFDDWVYRDRGLPDFKIDSVFPRQTLNGTYVVTVTVSNAGQAAAEVPVIARASQGERSTRILVPAGQKAVARIEIAAYPSEVVVNDGSVPEADSSNNSFTVPPPQQ